MKRLSSTSTLVDLSLLEDQPEMLDLPEEKLLLTPMEVGEDTEEVLSPEKTHPKSIDLELMPSDGLPRVWSPPDYVTELWLKSPMVSVFLTQSVSTLTLTELLKMD
jgi:hypothetical protein